jgi:hypothetical protein
MYGILHFAAFPTIEKSRGNVGGNQGSARRTVEPATRRRTQKRVEFVQFKRCGSQMNSSFVMART